MKKTKYLIIGAGISGLTFANYIGDNYLILEKENEVGGYAKTIRRNGYTWDYAGHFFHFNTDEFKEKFLTKMDKNDIVTRDKCTKIFYRDRLIDYPFQTNIHELDKEEFIDCLYDLFNKETKESYDNFLDMLYGKFGKSITEKFLKPYNEKLYAVDLTELDTDAMGRFFPYADIPAIINNMKKSGDSGSYNNKFMYPKKGASAFVDIIYNEIDKSKVLLNTEAVSIDRTKKIVTTNSNEEIKYEYLINTMPLNIFLKEFNDDKLNKFANGLSYNKVLVFNLGFDRASKYTDEHWLYIPDKQYNFYRIGFYNNILGEEKLSMYIEIGYGKNDEITKQEIDKQLNLTLQNLEKMGVITKDTKLVDHSVIIMNPAYVHIENDDAVRKVLDDLSKDNIYSVGRYGSWTYCSMEDSMVAAKELSKKLASEI